MRSQNLNRAKTRQNNEFYTRYEDVKFFVENSQIKDYLKGKVVYLPCDTEESQILKYLKDVKEEFGIKEILFTSDDYYGHIDLYKKADVVLTNPPFTRLGKWLKWLTENNIKFISWCPLMDLYRGMEFINNYKFIVYSSAGGSLSKDNITKDVHCLFNTPEGIEKFMPVLIISNDNYFENFEYIGNAFKKSFEEVKDKLFKVKDGYEVYCSRSVPNDYDGFLYINKTTYLGRQKYFEIFNEEEIIGKDGKVRPRLKVKLKLEKIKTYK